MSKNSTPHSELTADARAALSGNWGTAVAAFLVFGIIAGSLGVIPLIGLLVVPPLTLGFATFCKNIARDTGSDIGQVFSGFQNFGNVLGTYIISVLLILVGFIFLIVPGIILAYGFSQIYFIMSDNPSMSPSDVLHKSWDMMKGNKLDFFFFSLRFIGWGILCIFTLGIGVLWLVPYYQVSAANYYDSINPDLENKIDDHLVDLRSAL